MTEVSVAEKTPSPMPRSGRGASLALIFVTYLFVVPALASAAGFTAQLHAANHSPTAGRPWLTTVTATHGQTKLRGTVRYQFVYHGKIVNTQPTRSFKDGVYKRRLDFPPAAVGNQLVLRVTVQTTYGKVVLNWAFKARG